MEAELSTREGLNVDNPTSVITENKVDENLNEDERNVIISEQEVRSNKVFIWSKFLTLTSKF